jgi:hypothetical protein
LEKTAAENRRGVPMKVMVIGHARHGKDTVGELLKKNYGLSFTSSSLFCADKVMMPAFARARQEALDKDPEAKLLVYDDAQACFEDRHAHRKFWHDEITAYCDGDLSRLTREILASCDVYCGCRNDREFLQSKGEGAFNLSLWVDRSLHVKPEPRESMKLERWMADAVVDNNGTEEQLEQNLIRVVNPFVVAHRSEWLRLRLESLGRV